MRAYSLYFDTSPTDWERRRRTVVLALVVAAHLFLIGWALRTQPRILRDASSLVVVMLTDAMTRTPTNVGHHADLAKSVTTNAGLGRDKAAPKQPTKTLRVADTERPIVAEGQLERANGDSNSSSAAFIAEVANSAGGNETDAGRSNGSGASHQAPFIPPRVVHRWKPPYPPEAYSAHLEGESELLVTIGADGSLKDARINTSSGSDSLDQAALDAVKRYTHSAAEKGGNSIEADAIVVVEWKIGPAVEVSIASGMTQSTR